VAVTDWKGGVYNPEGLRIKSLVRHCGEHRTVHAYSGGDPLAHADLFKLDVDILIPAALEGQITSENMRDIKAKLIVEGANGPTTPEANQYLYEKGVFIVPDILANAGGVTVSYFEWVQDRHGYFWPEHEVNERLEAKIYQAFTEVLQVRSATTSTCGPPPTSSPSIGLRR
jgi:glutamate dehydrogenase/leucine dehydrogenase